MMHQLLKSTETQDFQQNWTKIIEYIPHKVSYASIIKMYF